MKTKSNKFQSNLVEQVKTGIGLFRFRGNLVTLQCSDADELEEFLSCLAIMVDDSLQYRKKYRNGALCDAVETMLQHLLLTRDNIARL